MIARIAAAASICPRCPRSAWISGRSGAVEPMIASVDIAEMTQRVLRRPPGAEEPGQRAGGRELRAVDQRQPLLGRERHRREPRRRERRRAGHPLAADLGLAVAEHHRRHVGERREVARGPDRALRRHHRRHARGQHRLHELDQLPAHARRAAPERDQLQRHHQPHDRRRRRLADAGSNARGSGCAAGARCRPAAMRHARELAEAGVDAIDRRARREPLRRPAPPPPRSPARAAGSSATATRRARRPPGRRA